MSLTPTDIVHVPVTFWLHRSPETVSSSTTAQLFDGLPKITALSTDGRVPSLRDRGRPHNQAHSSALHLQGKSKKIPRAGKCWDPAFRVTAQTSAAQCPSAQWADLQCTLRRCPRATACTLWMERTCEKWVEAGKLKRTGKSPYPQSVV